MSSMPWLVAMTRARWPVRSTSTGSGWSGCSPSFCTTLRTSSAGGDGRRITVEFRYVGNSGFKISEITYGNWLTHGSQVENDQAKACVRAALDAGISTFDTADVYANTQAETVLARP